MRVAKMMSVGQMMVLTDYIRHTAQGYSIRFIANERGLRPSTILRRVRRVEDMRDDPEFDKTLEQLEGMIGL